MNFLANTFVRSFIIVTLGMAVFSSAHAQETFRHPRGFSVITFADDRLPVFDANWVVPHSGDPIVSELVSRILEKKLSPLEQWGATVSLDPDQDWILFQVKGFRKNSAEILSMFENVLFESLLSETEFQSEKARLIERINHLGRDPESMAQATLFGKKVYPTAEDVEKIPYASAVAFYRQYFKREFNPLVLIGKVNPNSNIFSEPIVHAPFEFNLAPQKPQILPGLKRLILYPGSDQVVIRILIPVPSASEPNSEIFWIANALLGGTSHSRLAVRIRDELGLTFGIGSQLIYKRSNGFWMISTSTRKELAPKLIKTLESELKLFFSNGITEAELESAKTYLAGSFPVNLASPLGLASQWMFQKLVGIKDPGLEPLLNRLSQAKLSTVNKILKSYYTPASRSTMRWVIVGPQGDWTLQLDRQFPSK